MREMAGAALEEGDPTKKIAPPAEVAPGLASFYRPELDAVRFVAFMGVFISHSYASKARVWIMLADTLRFGVCLFFMLSAYLITELLRREREKTGTLHLKKFYLRRILRIWPLYFLALGVCVGLGIWNPVWHVEASRIASSLLLAGNWYVVVYGWSANPMWSPLWTISIEEQFYVITPTVAKFGGASVNLFSWLTIALSYLVLWRMDLAIPQGSGVFANSVVQFQFFAAGSLLANYLKGRVPSIGKPWRVTMFLGGLGCWIAANRLGINTRLHTGATHLTPVLGWGAIMAGTLLIFLSFLGASDVRFPRPIVYLGSISYGLYVYHDSVLNLVHLALTPLWQVRGMPVLATVLSLAITCLIASISYRFFEQPFVRLKKRFTLVPSRPVNE
jgi:peptidoglycan/LPS O-acetylase OafA/YrhL